MTTETLTTRDPGAAINASDRFVTPAVAGLIAAAVALGIGELVAGLLRVTSPVVAVGEGVIRSVPPAVSEFAIAVLGGLNRPALVSGVLVMVSLFALVLGVVTAHRFRVGVAGVTLLGALAIAANVSTDQATLPQAVAPGLAAIVAGAGALRLLIAPLMSAAHDTPAADAPGEDAQQPVPSAPGPAHSRRRFLRNAGLVSMVAVAATAGGRWLQAQASAAASRIGLSLPAADQALDPLPDGADFDIDGLSSFVTSNDSFYRIDTALRIPQVSAEEWTLRVHGMVDREFTMTFTDLLERELVEADITLACVSNEVGGDLVGNARWLGIRLDDVLREAGVHADATQVVGRSTDGFTAGFPVTDAMDGRDALIAIGMNGEPLPFEHGFPVRLVVPGLYGYVSATKWLAELELTTFEAFDHYWKRRNWAEQAPIKTQSRIDTPRGLAELDPGEHVIAGVAWAQHRGIDRVEVQVDDGDWQQSELADAPNDDTWRQWRFSWTAEPGLHQLRVRATDNDGFTQDEERVDPLPDGAEGWHTVRVRVNDS